MQTNKTETAASGNGFIDARQWVAKYADYLYAYAMVRIKNEEQARDLVQETFLAGLEGIEKFEGRSSERTWLTGILKHKIIDTYRKKYPIPLSRENVLPAQRGQQNFFESTTGHWSPDYAPAAFGVEQPDAMENKEFNSALLSCMQKLPPLWLSVFTMKHMDNQNSEIICTELKVSPSNFWVIIHRAKLNLRACLQKNWI